MNITKFTQKSVEIINNLEPGDYAGAFALQHADHGRQPDFQTV